MIRRFKEKKRHAIYEKWVATGLLDTVTAEGLRATWKNVTRPLLSRLLGRELPNELPVMSPEEELEARMNMALLFENQARQLATESRKSRPGSSPGSGGGDKPHEEAG